LWNQKFFLIRLCTLGDSFEPVKKIELGLQPGVETLGVSAADSDALSLIGVCIWEATSTVGNARNVMVLTTIRFVFISVSFLGLVEVGRVRNVIRQGDLFSSQNT
jgi:hypothetical protein